MKEKPGYVLTTNIKDPDEILCVEAADWGDSPINVPSVWIKLVRRSLLNRIIRYPLLVLKYYRIHHNNLWLSFKLANVSLKNE